MNISDKEDKFLPAFDAAITNYIRSRREKVPAFVGKYFSFKGALRINKHALGADLYKVPLNVAWSVPYLGMKTTSALLKRLGLIKISRRIGGIPSGFETRVQREINWLIFTDLLELPYSQKGRTSTKDALLREILNQPQITAMFADELAGIHSKSKNPGYRAALEKNLVEYGKSRTAAADIAGNIIALSAGAAAFGQTTPGSLTAGSMLAAYIAHQIAVANFVLGPTLGGLYYSVFPAAASTGLIVASTGGVVAALAVLTSFSGIVTDPVQAKLGIHKRRLIRLIDSLEGQLRGNDQTRLKIRDQYYARIFDLLDLLKRAARTFV
jgi:hypothetical protein